MTPEDMAIQREVRRYLERRQLDCSVAQVSVNKGVVYLAGQIRQLRSARDVDVKDEIDVFHKQIMRVVPSIKSVSFEWRVIVQEKQLKEHEAEPHGSAGTAPAQPATNTTHRPGGQRHP